MAFNPKEHLINLKGKEYLEAKWRIVWFREDHPNGCISTELVHINDTMVMFRATVATEDGQILASGHGSAQVGTRAVWTGRETEKAETAAVARALGNAGYGTQFTAEDETDHLADSPVDRAPAKSATENEPAEGEVKEVRVTRIEVWETRDGKKKPYLRLFADGGPTSAAFTRQILKDRNIIDPGENSTDLTRIGDGIGFEPPIPATFVYGKTEDGRGYWSLQDIVEFTTYEKVDKGVIVNLSGNGSTEQPRLVDAPQNVQF